MGVWWPLWLKLIEAETNDRYFAHIFKCIFLNDNVWISIKISPKVVPRGPIKNIGSDNGLAPTRPQAIIWNNSSPGYRQKYVSLGLNELTVY